MPQDIGAIRHSIQNAGLTVPRTDRNKILFGTRPIGLDSSAPQQATDAIVPYTAVAEVRFMQAYRRQHARLGRLAQAP